MRCLASAIAGLALLLSIEPLAAQEAQTAQSIGAPIQLAQVQKRPPPPVRPAAGPSEQAHKDRINAWTVGLAAGRLEGAPLRPLIIGSRRHRIRRLTKTFS